MTTIAVVSSGPTTGRKYFAYQRDRRQRRGADLDRQRRRAGPQRARAGRDADRRGQPAARAVELVAERAEHRRQSADRRVADHPRPCARSSRHSAARRSRGWRPACRSPSPARRTGRARRRRRGRPPARAAGARRWSPSTTGDRMNDSRTASMIGTRTSRARNSAATVTTPTASASSAPKPGTSAGATCARGTIGSTSFISASDSDLSRVPVATPARKQRADR